MKLKYIICGSVFGLLIVITSIASWIAPVTTTAKSTFVVDEKTRIEQVSVLSGINLLQQETSKLKDELAVQRATIKEGLAEVEANKGKDDETQVTLPNNSKYSLAEVRRDLNRRLNETESLQPRIAENEARIAELQKRKEEISADIKEKEKAFWNTPSDDELLNKGKELLGTPPLPAK
jgi:chromosome segregation ATPase